MDKNRQDIRYEELYNRLLERGEALHENNKKRIRKGLIFLGVFTVLMILIRLLTNSDRVIFMILWVVGMFITSIYLISVEYIDDSLQKTLTDVSDREAGFDELLPDTEQVREIVHSRLQEHHEEVRAKYIDHWKSDARESEDEQ
ncbi:MAG: hypothetical protein IKG44_08070 [Mogibacterium sp.]|nr:hypothetical protein [Mogibacterium sp.]